MSRVQAYPMTQVKEVANPETVYHNLMEIIIKLAEHGLVHGDFNEFNLMINENEEITVIDFPQMTSTGHPNAQFYFERDVRCIQDYFSKKYGLIFDGVPTLESDIDRTCDLDKEIKASGFVSGEEMEALEKFGQELLDKEGGDDETAEAFDEEETKDEEEQQQDEEEGDSNEKKV